MITGKKNALSQFGSFKGAPEPSRDLFVYRVAKTVDQTDIMTYLRSQAIDIRGLSCVSYQDAKFRSFKLTMGISHFDKVFDDSFWPSGVRVRRFIPPKTTPVIGDA